MRSKTIAVFAVALLLVASVAPAMAHGDDLAVTVGQDSTGTGTVTVTHNGTALANSSVTVAAVNGTYAGAGNYTTDGNGTVSLPAPSENVTVEVTAVCDNDTITTTANLTAVKASTDERSNSFGSLVSAFVHSLFGNDAANGGLGRIVSTWVLEHNPGNAPAHAGPPSSDEHGKPAFAAANHDGNWTRDDANVTDAAENETDDHGNETARWNATRIDDSGEHGHVGANASVVQDEHGQANETATVEVEHHGQHTERRDGATSEHDGADDRARGNGRGHDDS